MVGIGKAQALAYRLQRVNPTAEISGHGIGVPIGPAATPEARVAFTRAEILVDCTTSDAAFDWLDEHAAEEKKRLIMMFINFHAEYLTICISGIENSCARIYRDLQSAIWAGETEIDSTLYFYEPPKADLIIEGAGCWHPTFLALGAHITMLTASATDLLAAHLSTNKQGLAAVLRRSQRSSDGFVSGPIIEIAWAKTYK